MPKKHAVAPASVAAMPPLPARLLEILVALPVSAWIENSGGEVLASNRGRGPATPAAIIALANQRNAPGKITTFPLPPIKGCPRRSRLVVLVSKARENDCLARVIFALLALSLDASHRGSLRRQLTPQQRDIYGELFLGRSYKEIAHNLGISHNTVLVQLTHMRKRLGAGVIPRLRRRHKAALQLS